jgi:hypothetical protein
MHLPQQFAIAHLTDFHSVLMVGRFAKRMVRIAYQTTWKVELNGRGQQDGGFPSDSWDVGLVVHWGGRRQDAADTGYIQSGWGYSRIDVCWRSIGYPHQFDSVVGNDSERKVDTEIEEEKRKKCCRLRECWKPGNNGS